MLFNSYIYIFIFLPFVFLTYFYLIHRRLLSASKVFLVFTSLLFYSYWNMKYLPLILGSMLFNYTIGNILNENRNIRINKKSVLFFSVFLNLALLGYFKYADFFISNFNLLTNSTIDFLHLALPLAISFFTFQQIAYLVDSYKNETKEYDFLNYALFVTFFPQLIAGPIVHHKEMMPQFFSKWNMAKRYKNIALGIFIFSIGLFKKVVIADTFSTWVTMGFDHNSANLEFFSAWATSLSYTFQLYFDFSGYTDMAIGSALLFNIKLPINFNSPYKAISIQDFWRRWHITLSRFLRDYIYIPLGGNRKTETKTYFNLFITFLLGGLWHGASWMFVLWGIMHGSAMIVHRIWKKLDFSMNKYIAWFITFNFINITWIFFRAKDLESALNILKGMFFGDIIFPSQLKGILSSFSTYGIEFGDWMQGVGHYFETLLFILVVFFIIFQKNSMEMMKLFKPSIKYSIMISILFLSALLSMNTHVSEFLYFNF
jgi:alginate O-acetyltransferase complex protein AlgI